jgi:septum formation protein
MINGLILASASAARAGLLKATGLPFRVEQAGVDEWAVKRAFHAQGRQARDCALALAEAKAQRVAERHNRSLVIGADQILVCGDAWFD